MATRRPEDAQRKEYSGAILFEEDIAADPIIQFEDWYRTAEEKEEQEANAMSVASVSADGIPSTRIVLLKSYDASGFTFFSNYESRKSTELLESGHAALLFWWPRLARQVRIEGPVNKTGRSESEEYFATRPRGSQIGAWASKQSHIVASRSDLSEAYRSYEAKFDGRVVPCPPHWGGFRVMPRVFEFWQGQENRLHDRIQYTLDDSDRWSVARLSP
ncbi:MAG: pyridoxamine 5'-phosphate oxidase [Rhodothermales bacterium]|nr:pyridoxamine 5'-phosphate oxidase [Rhodothermales bacterium]